MGILDVIFDWQQLVDRGTDVVIYFVMGAVGTLLFVIRLALASFGGGDAEFDTDLDSGVDSDASFSFFSLLSILAFFMGAGWMGLACRLDFEMGSLGSAMSATGFGLGMMLLASGLTYATRRLNKRIDYDMQTAIGRTGRAYVTIPEKGQGPRAGGGVGLRAAHGQACGKRRAEDRRVRGRDRGRRSRRRDPDRRTQDMTDTTAGGPRERSGRARGASNLLRCCHWGLAT